MIRLSLLHGPSQPPQPWKNGGGVTRELFTDRPGDAWRMRISLADITRDGPFSAFPGVQRWFTVVQGAGVRLGFADGERRMTPSSPPLGFDGAAAPDCWLIDGETRDLNLMLRGGARGGMALAASGRPWAAAAGWRGLFTAAPARLDCGDGQQRLEAMSLAYLAYPAFAPDDSARPWTVHTEGPAWWLWAGLPVAQANEEAHQ